MRADAVPQRLDEFIADGQRQWQAFSGHDEKDLADGVALSQRMR